MDFEETLTQLEEDQANKVDKVAELAENSTPEEVQALKELYEAGEEGSLGTEKPENASEKTPEPDKKTTEEPVKKLEADDKVKEVETKEEIPLETKPITISEDYISKADEKDRSILQGIKGEVFSPKGLQNYINAQRKIGELGTKVGELSKAKEMPEEKKLVPDKIPQQQLTEEVEKLKEIEILNRVRKAAFPDLPEDPEEAEEYLNSLPYVQQRKYDRIENSVRNQVDEDFSKAIYYQQHQKDINIDVLSNDIEKIKAELLEDGIGEPEKFGLDFTISKDANGISNNALLQELITTDGKNIDPSLVTYVGNVPIFNKDALYNKFFAVKRKLIREILKKQTSIDARKDAFQTLSKQEEAANNTASTVKGGGATGSKYKGKDLENVDELNPKEVSELLKEMEKN